MRSLVGVRCIAVMDELWFNCLTMPFASLKRDGLVSGLPKEIKILYLPCRLISSGTASSVDLKILLNRSIAGPVIKVVTRAIITIMANISAFNTPRSNPIFSTINSIKPRVFINAPMVRLSFQFCPINLAARELPTNLPTTATRIIQPVTFHKYGSFSKPISVLNPVKTKNKGNSRTKATSSTFSMKIFLNLEFSGMMAPAINAPNKAWIPITSVR